MKCGIMEMGGNRNQAIFPVIMGKDSKKKQMEKKRLENQKLLADCKRISYLDKFSYDDLVSVSRGGISAVTENHSYYGEINPR